MPKPIPFDPRGLTNPTGTCMGCGKPSNLAFCEACLPSNRAHVFKSKTEVETGRRRHSRAVQSSRHDRGE